MPYFAETERLIIRGSRDSDADAMLALLGDIRYRRSGPVAVVPPSEAALRGTVKAFNEKLLLLGILEAKDGGAFVGLVTLLPEGAPKNRELQFGVELVAEHEGKGYGACFSTVIRRSLI
jgi:RimJ/RimL family protein N-acetyltransferase